MKNLLWLLQTAALIFISFPLAVLPYRLSLKIGALLGASLFCIWGGRRRIAIDNIEKSIQAGGLITNRPAPEIAKACFINFGKSFVEVLKMYYGLAGKIIDAIEVNGADNFVQAKAKGKGVITITGHCGNWELLATAFGVRVAPASGVARAQNNPYLNRIIEKARSRYGNRLIYKKGALKGILTELNRKGVVGILMDQAVVREEGFIVDFLGRGAWTTKMPALIARKTGSPVVPVFLHRDGKRHVMTIHPEIRLSENKDAEKALMEDTGEFTSYIEDYIKQHPDEWLWIHRRWKRAETPD